MQKLEQVEQEEELIEDIDDDEAAGVSAYRRVGAELGEAESVEEVGEGGGEFIRMLLFVCVGTADEFRSRRDAPFV